MRTHLKYVFALVTVAAVLVGSLPAVADPPPDAQVPTTTPSGATQAPVNPTAGIPTFNSTDAAPDFVDVLGSVAVSASSVQADGTTAATVTVTLRDASQNALAGKVVSLTTGAGSSTKVPAVNATTNSSGQAVFNVTDTVAESVTYTAVDTTDAVTVGQTTVTFTQVSTGNSTGNQGNSTGSTTQTGGSTGTDTSKSTSTSTVTTNPDGTQSISVTSSTSTAQTNATSNASLNISAGGGVAQLQMDSGTIPASTGSDSSGSASSAAPVNVSIQLAVLSLTNLPGLSSTSATGSTAGGGTGTSGSGSTTGSVFSSGAQTTAPQPLPTVLKPQVAVDILATQLNGTTGTTGGGTSSSGQAIHQLAKPVTISFNVPTAILSAANTVVVAYYNATLGIWVLLPTKVDPTTGKVSTTVSHFTTFAVFTSDTATSTLTGVPSGTVAAPLVSISGTSVAGTSISVYDNGALVQSLPLAGASAWSIPLQLQPGVNALTVVANQAGGQVGIGESTVTYNAPTTGTATSTGSSSGSSSSTGSSSGGGVSTGGSASTTVSFPDLGDYGWAQSAILDLAGKGIMSDYNGVFHPEYVVSRAEFVDTLVKALHLTGTTTLTFSDVAEIPDGLQTSVSVAVANGLLKGYPDGTLRARAPLTRAQAAALLARALKLAPVPAQSYGVEFRDAAELPAWSVDSIQQVAVRGLMRGYADGAFHAADLLTRAQVAVLVENYLRLKK